MENIIIERVVFDTQFDGNKDEYKVSFQFSQKGENIGYIRTLTGEAAKEAYKHLVEIVRIKPTI